MSIIVKNGRFVPTGEVPLSKRQITIASDIDLSELLRQLDGISTVIIKISSPTDGRGNSVARFLRLQGFNGHLRASGYVLADQYPLVLRSGFNDVEIPDNLAARQPEAQWLNAVQHIEHNYQSRLISAVPSIGAA